MAIRKRGSKWQADVTVQGRRLPRYSFDNEDEARAWEMEARAAALVGKPIPVPHASTNAVKQRQAEAWTLGRLLDEAFKQYWQRGSYSDKVQHNIKQLEEYFGFDKPVHEIDHQEIVGFVEHRRRLGNGGGTINRKLAVLSKALRLAQLNNVIDRMPHIPKQKEGQNRIRFLTHDEEHQILGWMRHFGMPDHADAFAVFLDTGMRMSELWRLQPKDVNWTTGLITLWETKGGKPRSIPMTSRVRSTLKRRLHDHGGFFDYDARPDRMNDWYRKGWEKVRRAMRMTHDPHFVPYVTRHTCCSRLVQSGVDLVRVQTWMGHSSIQTTMRYAHLAPDALSDLARVLEPTQETEAAARAV